VVEGGNVLQHVKKRVISRGGGMSGENVRGKVKVKVRG